MELRFENVSKTYGKTKALDEFTASVGAGVYGLIGPNGSGKSTLMKIISKNILSDGGDVLYNGVSTDKLGTEFLATVGYMPQESSLYPQLTVYEFMHYMAEVKGLDRKASEKQIDEVLNIVSLFDAKEKRISQLSGGMRQRTCFAQALLGDPKVLLLDEPTAGLDPAQRVAVRSMLARLSADRIILLATHVIGDVEGIAKELILISKGKLLESITPELMAKKMEGLVYTVSVPSEKVSEMYKNYNVVSVKVVDGSNVLRMITDTPPENAVLASPTLEDAYLHIYGASSFAV